MTENILKRIITPRTKTNGETFVKTMLLTFANIAVAYLASEIGNLPAAYVAIGGATGVGLPVLFWKGISIISSHQNGVSTNKQEGTDIENPVKIIAQKRGALDKLDGKEIDNMDEDFGRRGRK